MDCIYVNIYKYKKSSDSKNIESIANYAKKHNISLFTNYNVISDTYNRFLVLSPNILIRPDCPNLFEILEKNKIHIMKESRYILNPEAKMLCDKNKKEYDWYDFSVVMLDREDLPFIHLNLEEKFNYLQKNNNKIKELDYFYNRIPEMDQACGESRFASYIINYSSFIHNEEKFKELIEMEVKNWNPPYVYKDYVALMVDGCGLGDVTCCEPVARFAKEDLFPNDNLILVTDKPELFNHLDIPIYGNKDLVPNASNYYKMYCFGDVESPTQGRYLSHSQIHCIDFCSLMAYRRQIPNHRKPIKLPDYRSLVPEEYFAHISRSILVHPGKHWKSKTFSKEVWESYVKALVENGYKITLVGKTITEDQGVVKLDPIEGVLDLTDKLDLKQFIGAVNLAPGVLSNDSAILHIAGAFNGWIFPILSCKEWDYVMPYRKGRDGVVSQSYKAHPLNNGYVYTPNQHKPNQIRGFKIDECTDTDLERILPTPKQLVYEINEASRRGE